MQLSCPTADRLREFLEGSVDDADANQISGHVVECPDCDRVLGTLESEQNDVVKTLREGVRTESLLQEPEFEQLRNTARFSQADTTAPADVDEHLETGKRLRDYRLVKKIGEGGMGTVYQAFHVHLAKHVALKILPSDKLRSKQSVSRFRQEMRAVGSVNHPNVVSASDAGTIDGQHFLVMELVQGADLARIILDRGPLKVADACAIVRQAAIGLQHAHDNGLVHRDVKPSNIMLALDGSVKLLDLGLAGLNNSEFESTANVVVTDRLTSVGQIMGTLDYMAPEQITASPEVDGKADIYALGATLFQLLTGRTPCGDRSEGLPQRIEAVLHKPPLDIATLRNDVPEELCSLLQKMLAKTPDDRPQSAIDVAGELVRYTSDADLGALAEECRTSLDIPSADVDVTDDVSFVVSRTPQPQGHAPAQRPYTAAALFGLFLALVASVIFYMQTDYGTVRVKVMDESLAVKFGDKTIRVGDWDKEFAIRANEQRKLVVIQNGSDFQLETESFLIRRNGEVALEVDIVDGKVVVMKDKEPFGNKELEPMPPLIAENPTNEAAESSNDKGDRTSADHKTEGQGILNFLYEGNPDLTQKYVELYVKRGDYEGAKQILSSVKQADPKATAALKIAKIQEQKGEIEKAADSTLEAIRLTPWLLSDKQLPLIKKAGRVPQLIELLTEERLSKLGHNNYLKEVVNALVKDEATRAEGFKLLARVSVTDPHAFRKILGSLEQKLLNENLDPAPILRKNLIPTNFAAEGAGWERFGIDSYASDLSNNYSLRTLLEKLSPVIQGNLRKTVALNTVAREVENQLEQHPGWKAGVAVLGYLQAELGNEQQAVALFEKALAEKDSPMPPNAAWVFGLALEGNGKTLDQLVMRLYERKISGPEDSPGWRYWPIKELADLYATYGRRKEARELLFLLTKPQAEIRCTPGWQKKHEDASCVKCHKTDRSFDNFTLLSSKLTDLGYPVDAYFQLARIDASFHNLPSSDDKWVNQNADKFINRRSSVGDVRNSRFEHAENKAVKGITPQAVLSALESGVFLERAMKRPVIAASASRIDLMLGVRGENGKSTLFSPVIDLLENAAKAKGDDAAIANVRIDQLLSEAFDENPDNVEAGIAATVFAFLRNDLDAAERRTQKLEELVAGKDSQESEIALWLVARLALVDERTKSSGRKLGDRAVAAAEKRGDRLWQEAIARERDTIAASKPDPSPIDGFLRAKEAYVRAKRLERSGDVVKAADAYLEAYHGDPTLLAYEQFATIKQAKRTREFVEVFNAERLLLVPLTGNPVERIAKDLVEDKATRLDGRALLDQMWVARPDDQWPLLGNPPKDTVFRIRDPLIQIRKKPFVVEKLPPTDPDWKRFRVNNQFAAKGRYGGLLQKLAPQLKDTVEQKIHLAKTVCEVEKTIEKDPFWKAGIAVLAYLEAELGNEQRAVELIEQVLADSETPIIPGAAMTFGQALEGRTAALDKLVMRLYEKSVAEWADYELGGSPDVSLNCSPIQNLAGLYAKYGRREETRRLLLHLTVPEGIGVGGSEGSLLACPEGSVLFDYSKVGPDNSLPNVLAEDQVPNVNCMACHRKERNLWSYLSMSDNLTDLGYPVDARLSLARIDASFGNSFTSDEEWAKARTPKLNRAYGGGYFQPINEKVNKAITAQAVLRALESGAVNDVDLTKPVIAKNATFIDLMLSVRGENGKSTLFSPVVDLLELAEKSKGDAAAVANVKIDQLLSAEFETHPDNLEAGIAATVFTFLRGHWKAAEERSQTLYERVSVTKPGQSDIALWLVARLALDRASTESNGEAFARRALAAAEKSAEPLFKEAILREQEAIGKITALRNSVTAGDSSARGKKDLMGTAVSGDVLETLVAAIEAAGLSQTLAESGPFTILAPTDEAFAKLPKQTLKNLLEPENKDKLAKILKYHVIPGRIPASDVAQAKSLVTLIGEPVFVGKQKGRLTANKANVIASDLSASNGFIHVIDEVLIPRGRTIVSGLYNVAEYDLEGNKIWEAEDLTYSGQCWVMNTGERVIKSWPNDQEFMDFTGLSRLAVYGAGDGPARKLWSLTSVRGACPLPAGEILVWDYQFIRRYARDGRKIWQTSVVWKGQKRRLLGVEPLPNGNLKVLLNISAEGRQNEPDTAVEIDLSTQPNTAVEIDEQGRAIRELPYLSNRKLLDRLPNGNALLLIDDDDSVSIEERDSTENIVWSYTNDKRVITAQRLPGGDTLIGAVSQVKTIDLSGNVTWKLDESLLTELVSYYAYRYYPVLGPRD